MTREDMQGSSVPENHQVDDPGTPPQASLKGAALRGGRDLAVREVLGIILTTLATIYVLRELGTSQYGLVGFGLGVSAYAAGVATLGLNVFLVRQERMRPDQSGQLLVLVGASAAVVAAVIAIGSPLAARFLGDEAAATILLLVAASVFLKAIGQVPVALLERDMDFGRIAKVDFASLFVYYAVLFPLVHFGWGATGVWIANVVQILAATAGYFAVKPVLPAAKLDPAFCREALVFGVGYQSSTWIYSLRELAGPLILPRLAGASALGVYSATVQIVQRLSFLRVVVWRVAVPGLSRIQGDPEATRRGVERAMVYVAVLLGGALSLLSAAAGWLIPAVFSAEWTSVATVLPFVAIAAVLAGVFALHSAALVSVGAIKELTVYHVAMVLLVWGSAVLLAPRFGAVGLGVAEMVGCGSYVLLAWLVHRRYGAIDYSATSPIVAVASLSMVASAFLPTWAALAVWVLAAAIVLVSSSKAREALIELYGVVFSRRSFA